VGHDVNVLIFPNLASGNIAYNLLQEVSGVDLIGPILLGLNKPVHILQLGSHIQSIYNMVLVAVIDAQTKCKNTGS
jgi:malate dehydrogenase (oxaloacetate-decarboxylating)(NADP+)